MITYFTPASIQHFGRDLACVSTLLLEVHILRTNHAILVPFAASIAGMMSIAGTHRSTTSTSSFTTSGFNVLYQLYCLAGSHVHLPVAGYNFLSCHFKILFPLRMIPFDASAATDSFDTVTTAGFCYLFVVCCCNARKFFAFQEL